MSFKVHKRENFLAPILNSLLFLHSICLNIKVLYEKKFDLAINQDDTIFPRIHRVNLILNMR
jgi:hypothetical protein